MAARKTISIEQIATAKPTLFNTSSRDDSLRYQVEIGPDEDITTMGPHELARRLYYRPFMYRDGYKVILQDIPDDFVMKAPEID